MALAYFYSKDNKTYVSMDIETSITVSQQNQSTKSSMMTGSSASDGYTIGNKVVSLEGMVTSSKTPYQEKNNLSPEDFRSYIEETINNKTRFSVNFSFPDGGTKLLDRVDNCVITSIAYVVDKYEDTMKVSLTFEEQFVSLAATETVLTPEKVTAAKESYSSSKDTEASTGGKVANNTEVTKSWLIQTGESLASTFFE